LDVRYNPQTRRLKKKKMGKEEEEKRRRGKRSSHGTEKHQYENIWM
jgi:hypothetical protein